MKETMSTLEYPVEVGLLASTWPLYKVRSRCRYGGAQPMEDLVEYAGRLCYNSEDKCGTAPTWLEGRIKAGHESILEHASMTFEITASRAFTHELVRHRIASYSQRSQRYVDESEPAYITPPELEDYEFFDNVTASSMRMSEFFPTIMNYAWEAYKDMLAAGVPKEIARYVLPNACRTKIVVTMNLRELRHFLKLRTSPRALPEMRAVANEIKAICKMYAPQVFGDL